MNGETTFTKHALERWERRAELLGLDGSYDALHRTFSEAVPERARLRAVRWHLLKRSIVHRKPSRYLVADGWRFVVSEGACVNVERVLPHENFGR